MSLYTPEWLDRRTIAGKYGHFRPSLLQRKNGTGGTLALYQPRTGSWQDYQTAAQARAVEDALRSGIVEATEWASAADGELNTELSDVEATEWLFGNHSPW